MMQKTHTVGINLTEGSIMRALFIFTVPIIFTNLIQQLYSMVDLMVIGRYVGTAGTVGVATGGEISDFLTPIATSFATAGQIYIAQLTGAKRIREQKRAIGSFISLMMMFSFAMLLVTVIFRSQILRLLNCPSEAFSEAERYMIITAVGFPFIFGYNAVCGALRGMGESKKPLLFIIVAAVINIILDIVLVVIFHLDVAGTAIATMFSQAASFTAAFVYMYQNREDFDFELKLSYFKPDREAARIILKLGVPQAARSVLVRLSMLWVNSQVNAYGLVASSTNSVGNKIQKFFDIFTTSLSQAGGAMVGQNLGAEKYDRSKKVVYCTCVSSFGISVLISLLILTCSEQIFGIFINDPAVLALGAVYLRIMIVYFCVSAVTSSFQCMVIGAGNTALNFIVGILDGVVCKIGLSLLLARLTSLGVLSYFWGTSLSRILPGMICIAYFCSGRWKNEKLLR